VFKKTLPIRHSNSPEIFAGWAKRFFMGIQPAKAANLVIASKVKREIHERISNSWIPAFAGMPGWWKLFCLFKCRVWIKFTS